MFHPKTIAIHVCRSIYKRTKNAISIWYTESEVQPEAEAVQEGSSLNKANLLIEDDDEEVENLEDLEDPDGDKEDSPG